MKEIIYLKGKESVGIGLLLIVALIVFFIPIMLVLLLKSIFKVGQAVKEQAKIPAEVSTNLEKVY